MMVLLHPGQAKPDFGNNKVTVVPVAGGIHKLFGRRSAVSVTVKKSGINKLLLFDLKDAVSSNALQFLVTDDASRVEKKDFPLYKKLSGIITSSGQSKEFLMKMAGVDGNKIIVIEGLVKAKLEVPEYIDGIKFKGNVTSGREYFICADEYWTKENLVTLLKAFSRFKKMQQTSWKLLLTQRGLNPEPGNAAVFETLKTYKYRDEVILFAEGDETPYAHALGGAYCAISMQTNNAFPSAVLEAVECGCPVLVPDGFNNPTLPGLPAFLGGDDESLGIKLMELYKNEALRAQYAKNLLQHQHKTGPGPGLEELKSRLLQA